MLNQIKAHRGSYWYLATIYSKHPQGTHQAFVDSARTAAWMLRQGLSIYSPIAHTHPVAFYGNIDQLDHRIWLPFDEPFMHAALGLIVVMAEGWRESVGITHEIRVFREQEKPIYYFDPVSLRFSDHDPLGVG